MNRVNYTGLKKRDTYDEIVALVEAGGGVIKYPYRVASQILNSPYMKQIDNETLMDLQNQQERLNKAAKCSFHRTGPSMAPESFRFPTCRIFSTASTENRDVPLPPVFSSQPS